ncbi:MAG: TetR family transcriptional regulator [Leptospira sp.]|nr:MAG: TetR family transcriptional regulator [Leptospira sp.]
MKRSIKPPRRSRGSLTRSEILIASMEILQEEGVEALSMRRIAKKLGCSVASPYTHFQNQEEIIRELILEGEKKLTSDLKTAEKTTEKVYTKLNAIAHAYWDFAIENRELHKLMFNAIGGKLYRQTFPSLPTSYRVFLETIRYGITSGEIPHRRKDYPSIARTMWSWMYGLIVLEMNEILRRKKDSDPIKEGIELFTILLKRGGPLADRANNSESAIQSRER